MNKKRVILAFLKTILLSIIAASYTLGFFTALTLDSSSGPLLGYYAIISGPGFISLISILFLIKNILVIRSEFKVRTNIIIDREIAKKTEELLELAKPLTPATPKKYFVKENEEKE
jgi:hypothetical protein